MAGIERSRLVHRLPVPFSYATLRAFLKYCHERVNRHAWPSWSRARVSMVVVEPLEINNEAACSLKVLSHLRSNKRKSEGGRKGRAEREEEGEWDVLSSRLHLPFSHFYFFSLSFSLCLSLIFFLLSFTVSLFLPFGLFFHRKRDDDRESKLSVRRTKS